MTAVTGGYPLPFDIDLWKPKGARVYDAFLGGKENIELDRRVVKQTLRIAPDAAAGALANRDFLRRAVRYLVREAGIRQFIDIGCGLPAEDNVHEVAHETSPGAHVVYVDNDPVVLRHSQAMTLHEPAARAVYADVRYPREILHDPGVQDFIDFGRPVGLLLCAVLHHVTDEEDPAGIVACLRAALAPGSYLVISSFCLPGPEHPDARATARAVQKVFNDELGTGAWRERGDILRWFGDWTLLGPGLVPLPEWCPDGRGERCPDGPVPAGPRPTYHAAVGGVARRP